MRNRAGVHYILDFPVMLNIKWKKEVKNRGFLLLRGKNF